MILTLFKSHVAAALATPLLPEIGINGSVSLRVVFLPVLYAFEHEFVVPRIVEVLP